MSTAQNVLKGQLLPCCYQPQTGFYRDGFCHTGPEDAGLHTVCIQATEEFLEYTVKVGNDLVTPHPEWQFPGLKPGDKWCLCALRWKQAFEDGCAPPVYLQATHIATLEYIDLGDLKKFAIDMN